MHGRTISFCQETRPIDTWDIVHLLLSTEDAVVPCLKNTACGGIYLHLLLLLQSQPSLTLPSKAQSQKKEATPTSPGLGLDHQTALESEGNWGKEGA